MRTHTRTHTCTAPAHSYEQGRKGKKTVTKEDVMTAKYHLMKGE